MAPIRNPDNAVASGGSVMISEISVSDASGNAALIKGRAGATAAVPSRAGIAASSRTIIVPFPATNGLPGPDM